MAIVYQTFSNTGPGARITLVDADDLVINANILVGSTDSDGVLAPGSSHDITVHGTASGVASGIRVGDDNASDVGSTVRVTSTGLVVGNGQGIDFNSLSITLINDGTIIGGGDAVEIGGVGTGTSRVFNSGFISGESNAIEVNSNSTETIEVLNTGTLQGRFTAYNGDDGTDRLVNRGLIVGDVDLDDGADTFDNRGGAIEGAVEGGAGADTFFAGDGAEDFDGGDGFDTLDFRGSAGVTVSLRDGAGTGRAEGDAYVGFERVLGSQGSADTILGDDADNVLVGLGGDDILQGNGGVDRINGSAGVDRLRGGVGPDTFIYSAASEGGDLILDYGNVAGNNDTIGILAAGFGAGLAAGPLAAGRFQARADNVAQDADDRFVFRTTDATLWFDANGSGAGGLTLLADLQAGASLTAADILLL